MTQFYRLGGAERLQVELAEALNKRDVHTDILSMYTEDLPGVSEAKRRLHNRGIPAVHFLGMRIHPPIASIFTAILKLRRLIREHGYDIVETSMLTPSAIASWAMQGMRARHVAGLHQVFRRDRENSRQHKLWRASVQCNRRIRYYAISDYAADHWIKYSRTSHQHTRRIYNAINCDCFAATPDRIEVRRELGIPEDGRLAIYVGRLASYKGIDTLLDALGPELEQNRLFLLYVGLPDLHVKGTKEMLEQMKQRVLEAPWGDRVKMLGYRVDVPRLMASADVLVHPTRLEGFGLTLAEAMAVGLPVVASSVEGIPEVLAGTDSLMIPADDPQALRAAVFKTLNLSPVEATLVIKKGRQRAQDFRLARRTDEMIKLFEDVLSDRF